AQVVGLAGAREPFDDEAVRVLQPDGDLHGAVGLALTGTGSPDVAPLDMSVEPEGDVLQAHPQDWRFVAPLCNHLPTRVSFPAQPEPAVRRPNAYHQRQGGGCLRAHGGSAQSFARLLMPAPACSGCGPRPWRGRP